MKDDIRSRLINVTTGKPINKPEIKNVKQEIIEKKEVEEKEITVGDVIVTGIVITDAIITNPIETLGIVVDGIGEALDL